MTTEKKIGPFDYDPTPVPFRKEWMDNTGCMANAIFWLNKNWDKRMNAQGMFTDEQGRLHFWNYSWLTKILLVHVNGSREYWRIERDKMLHAKDGNEDMATIYRPFFQACVYGMSTHETNGEPIVAWLVTRQVVITKDHHPNRFPLYLADAMQALAHRLKNKPFPQFEDVKLNTVMVPIDNRGYDVPMNAQQVHAYAEVIKHLNFMRSVETDYGYEEHHIHSYQAMLTVIDGFNKAVTGGYPMTPEATRSALFEETVRLVKLGKAEAAAIVDALNFNRTYAESLVKTKQMVEANYQPSEEAN